jgi:hypothetical protein
MARFFSRKLDVGCCTRRRQRTDGALRGMVAFGTQAVLQSTETNSLCG